MRHCRMILPYVIRTDGPTGVYKVEVFHAHHCVTTYGCSIMQRGPVHPRSDVRTVARRAKSGCRTCRLRKIKCDEGRPSCRQCLSAHRTCGGYGIWGGGGSFCGNGQQTPLIAHGPERKILGCGPTGFPMLAASKGEKECLDWFRTRTLYKLTGSFFSGFWNTLVVQASCHEPAVLDAVLALSSVHRRGVNSNRNEIRPIDGNVPCEQERFTLQHYVKAIRHLQAHLSRRDKESFRVSLITCAIFIALELLRGHFAAAFSHLRNGLNVLAAVQISSPVDEDAVRLKPGRDLTDDWIIQAFSRLQFQFELFKQAYQGPCLIQPAAIPQSLDESFASINVAWQHLHELQNKIFKLADQSRKQNRTSSLPQPAPNLKGTQQQIQTELKRWVSSFEAFRMSRQGPIRYEESKGYKLLLAYEVMAEIMLDVCLFPNDESIFDSYTTQFVFIVSQLTEVWVAAEAYSPILPLKREPGRLVDMSRSFIEMGWVPPLYYTAVKCRVHRVRLHAVMLLELASHREGIWDSQISACVARKVVQLEERDFYRDVRLSDDFPLSSIPSPRDLSLPRLPDEDRIRGLGVDLIGDPVDVIALLGEQENDSETRRLLIAKFHVRSQLWYDA